MLNRTAVTMVSGAKPRRYSKPLRTTSASVENRPARTSPFRSTSANITMPNATPTAMPVNMDFFARFTLPAPIFCATNDAIDCISALGTSMTKLTILLATP